MTSFLYGMLGAFILNVVLLVAAALVAPRLARKAIQKKMGLALASQYGAGFANRPAASTTDAPVAGNRG